MLIFWAYRSEFVTFYDIFEQRFRPTKPSQNVGRVSNRGLGSRQPSSDPLGSPMQNEPFDLSSPLSPKFPSVDSHLREYSPDKVRWFESQSRIRITVLEQEREKEKERHQQQVDQENRIHHVTITQIEDHIRLIELSLGLPPIINNERSQAPAENEDTKEPILEETSLIGPDDNSILEACVIARSIESNLDTLPSPHAHFVPLEITGEMTASPVSEDESDRAIAEINNMAASTPSKRKRLSNIFLSLKKQRLHELMARDNDASAEEDVPMSELEADQVTDTPLPSVSTKQRLSRIFTSRLSFVTGKSSTHKNVPRCIDIPPDAPRFNHGSERPQSWPRSHRWRKSFGISVKQLRENFEKLTVDRVDHLPSRPIG